jgi:hypothetical protein
MGSEMKGAANAVRNEHEEHEMKRKSRSIANRLSRATHRERITTNAHITKGPANAEPFPRRAIVKRGRAGSRRNASTSKVRAVMHVI